MIEHSKIQRKKANTSTVAYPTFPSPTHGSGIESAKASSSVQNSPKGHDISCISLLPQAKLTVSQPQDPYEQEADKVANEVMRMQIPESNEALVMRSRHDIMHRKCVACEQEDKDLMPKENGSGQIDEAAIDRVHRAVQGGGQHLDDATRNFMEPRFGHDFSQVRIHADSQAAESAKGINARAYTLGQDVVFASGEYAPNTDSGKQLLAHELTHVVQQSGGIQTKLATGKSQNTHGQKADRQTEAVTSLPKSAVHQQASDLIRKQTNQEISLFPQGSTSQQNSHSLQATNIPQESEPNTLHSISKASTPSVQRLFWIGDKCASEKWNCVAAWATVIGSIAATVAALIGLGVITVGTAATATPVTAPASIAAIIGGAVLTLAGIAWAISGHIALSKCQDSDPDADQQDKDDTKKKLKYLEEKQKLIEEQIKEKQQKLDELRGKVNEDGTPKIPTVNVDELPKADVPPTINVDELPKAK
jgi:Domain of unknown function (DUF4157)